MELDSVRTASNSKKKPPTSIIPGDESRRRREGASTRRDAEIVPNCLLNMLLSTLSLSGAASKAALRSASKKKW